MNTEQILTFLKHKYITWTIIAYDLYPDLSKNSAKAKFNSKMNNIQGRKFSNKEEQRIIELYNIFKSEIEGEI